MKYLAQRMGLEKFRAAIEGESARVAAERGDELRAQVREDGRFLSSPRAPGYPAAGGRGVAGVRALAPDTNARLQKQPGYRTVWVQFRWVT